MVSLQYLYRFKICHNFYNFDVKVCKYIIEMYKLSIIFKTHKSIIAYMNPNILSPQILT